MALLDLMRASRALNHLLDAERDALLSGRFDALAGFEKEKERLMIQTAREKNSISTLNDLKRKSERNIRLLQAASRGLSDAKTLIVSLTRANKSLTVYGPAGAGTAIGSSGSTMTRKA
ncbi:hypothetical protein [Celeribacter arenosi]|uniref:Flagellar protein FlgN n=1 Tax=Celeribacter arenosi TaxID=792649 RepID=A0ABP7JXU5_9RHOB